MNIQKTEHKGLNFGAGAFKRFTEYAQSLPKPTARTEGTGEGEIPAEKSAVPCQPAGGQEAANQAPKRGPEPSKGAARKRQKKEKATEKSRRGKWTTAEHKRFIDAMEMFGNSWELVREHVQSRTAAQIRSHAQKYYGGLRKKEIRKIKSDPVTAKAIFVVTREYLNTTGMMLYKRKASTATTPLFNKDKGTDPASSQRHSSYSAFESKDSPFNVIKLTETQAPTPLSASTQ